MPKYELVRQEFSNKADRLWPIERADSITEEVLGEYSAVGMAAVFRSFLINEKKYGSDPTGILPSTAYYIREKVEPTGRKAILQFQGHTFNMPVEKAMELKSLLEAFIPGAVVLVSPAETAKEGKDAN